MVGLGSKYAEVPDLVIKGEVVFVMDYMARFKIKVFGYDGSSAWGSMFKVVWGEMGGSCFLEGLEADEVAEVVFGFSDAVFVAEDGIAACRAEDFELAFGCIHTGFG